MDIAIDTGGTFTDCVYMRDGRMQVLKLFSTGNDPSQALLHGVQQCVEGGGRGEPVHLRHGTTVGTNALLERKGARVAFVTTAGFEDTIAIGRQARAHLYDWFATPPPCIVPTELRFGVGERTAADGTVLRSPSDEELAELTAKIRASGAESIAVSLLFSFANPHNERLVAAALRGLGKPLSSSHIILPEFREYERASTVCVNAYLAPKVGEYLGRISRQLSGASPGARFEVMQSSGGIVPADFAAERPVRTVLSGPAGGVMGAYLVARQAGFQKIIGFDMGGTSTDVALIGEAADAAPDAGPVATKEAVVSGIPISVPMLDIHTVGAGGGSIARFDTAGILHVGPESAGANPGPICCGRGTEPTVSDANVILGRIRAEHFLGGKVILDAHRARHYADTRRNSIPTVYEFAAGIIRIAESTMERAIRVISVERGHNPRDFTLVAFGGAGPLHACGLAHALRIPRVLVPKLPGALSAAGILLADTVRDYSKTVMLDSASDLAPHFAELERSAAADGVVDSAACVTTRSLDIRYAGQGFELNVPVSPGFVQAFHAAHKRRYGYSDETRAIEIVNVRARRTIPSAIPATAPLAVTPGDAKQAILEQAPVMFDREWMPSKIYNRDLLQPGDAFAGPAIVVEYSATTVLPPGCSVRVDPFENLVIEVPS